MPDSQRVFVEQERLHIQMPATQENPAGSVRTLYQGWNVLDDELAAHPIVARLLPQGEGAQQRHEEAADMSARMSQGRASAGEELDMRQRHAQQQREELQAATDEWNSRASQAADRGEVFSELHPDPSVNWARSITNTTAHVVAAAGMGQKPLMEQEDKAQRESTLSEGESRQQMQGHQGPGGARTGSRGPTGQGSQDGQGNDLAATERTTGGRPRIGDGPHQTSGSGTASGSPTGSGNEAGAEAQTENETETETEGRQGADDIGSGEGDASTEESRSTSGRTATGTRQGSSRNR